MRSKLLILIISTVCVLTITSCGRSITQLDLIGKYELKHKFIRAVSSLKETLVLKPNGEFFQEVEVEVNGKKRSASTTGTWTFTPKDNRIMLKNYLTVLDGYEKFRENFDKPEVASFPVLFTLFGELKIESGETMSYRKIKSDSP